MFVKRVPRTSYLVPAFLALFLLFDIPICYARSEIHPRLFVRQEYNDNVFLSRWSEREGDFITTVEPGVSALWERRLVRLDLDYALRFRKYAEFTERDETRLRDTQRARAKAELFHGRPFTLTVLDEYSRVTVDTRGPVVDENPFVNRTNRNRLTVSPRYLFERRTWSAAAGYEYENLWYDAEAGDDSQAHRLTLDLTRALSPRMILFGALAGENRRFDNRQDYLRGDATAGATWKPSPRLALTARGGFAWIDFEEDAIVLPPVDFIGLEPEPFIEATPQNERRTATWTLSGTWQMRPAVALSASYSETVDLSVHRGLFERRAAEAAVAWDWRLPVTFRLYAREDDYIDTNRLDRAAGADLGIGVPLGRTLALAFNANVERLAFQPGDEDAWRARGTAALNYTGRYFTGTVGYNVAGQNSDVDENNYLNNILYVRAGVRL